MIRMLMKQLLDRHYKRIRPFRFLYGWAVDRYRQTQCSKRAEEWRRCGFRGAKLDICGGRNPVRPGEFLNVDAVSLPKVDLVFDIRKCFPIDSGVIAEIFSAATLEHFRKPDVHHILREFYRVLQPGGRLRVSTPDIEAIAHGILEGEDIDRLNQHLFGKFKSDETDDFDVHRWMYPAGKMMEALREIGFVKTERVSMDISLHDPRLNYMIRAEKPT